MYKCATLFPSKVRDISHENLNPFIGACIESPNILMVWSYCKKGSLQVLTYHDNDLILIDYTQTN